jgi:hypothetical protein
MPSAMSEALMANIEKTFLKSEIKQGDICHA